MQVVDSFPRHVRDAIRQHRSPATFFSSCSLDFFSQHLKFGPLAVQVERCCEGGREMLRGRWRDVAKEGGVNEEMERRKGGALSRKS